MSYLLFIATAIYQHFDWNRLYELYNNHNINIVNEWLQSCVIWSINKPMSLNALSTYSHCLLVSVLFLKVPTDGLIIKGWYQTITLAVYGVLTTVVQDRSSPPPPPPTHLRSKPHSKWMLETYSNEPVLASSLTVPTWLVL